VRRLWRRLRRLLAQSSIRLPGPPLQPEALRRGDRLQIGTGGFRVAGSVLLVSGPVAFRLEELDGWPEWRPVRLLVPASGSGPWTLVLGESRLTVPPDCIVRYPSGEA
jgi:hypothetical protein